MLPAVRFAILASVAAFLVTGCSGGSSALGRDVAIAAARAAVPELEAITGVISAKTGQFSDFDNQATNVASQADRHVWAVAFSGSFALSCGPARSTPDAHSVCPALAATMLVIIDQRDGTFIEATTPAESAP